MDIHGEKQKYNFKKASRKNEILYYINKRKGYQKF